MLGRQTANSGECRGDLRVTRSVAGTRGGDLLLIFDPAGMQIELVFCILVNEDWGDETRAF